MTNLLPVEKQREIVNVKIGFILMFVTALCNVTIVVHYLYGWSAKKSECKESFHVKRTRGHNFIISNFDEILPVASNTFQTTSCKVSTSDN